MTIVARPAPRIAASSARSARVLAQLVVGALAAVVAGYRVDRPALWRDEAASVTMAQRDWPAFLGTVAHVDLVHALYYAGLHVWFQIVPYTPFTLRLPSVIAVGAGAAVLVELGRRLAGMRAGVAAGAAAAVLPSLVWAGGEGRSYAFTALLASTATLALLVALEQRASRRRAAVAWIGYSAVLALTTVLFLDAALLAVAHLVTVAVIGAGKRVAGTLAIVVPMAALSPFLLLAVGQDAQVDWIALYGSPPLWTDGIEQQWFRAVPVMIAWAAVLLVGVLVALLRRRLPRTVVAVALPWAVLPPVLLSAVALVHAPVYWPRYVTFTAPAVALLLGVAVAAMPLPLTAVALLLLAGIAIPQVRADRQPRAKADTEMGLAASLVARSRSPDDGRAGIVYGQYDAVAGMTTRVEQIAYPADFRGLTDLIARVPLRESTQLFGEDIPTTAIRTTGLHTVWILLDMDSEPKTHVPAAQLKAAGFRETGRYRTPGSLLLRWTR